MFIRRTIKTAISGKHLKMETIYPTTIAKGIAVSNHINPEIESSEIVPQRWMLEQKIVRKNQPVLSANQLTSLSAMIVYMAHKSGQSEFRIERSLSDHFRVANAKCLPATHFDDAIRYLADILPA